MRFEKWEGLGNDFILTESDVTPAQARTLCDRRLGIGADGVLVVSTEGSMRVLNADGSRPEMCGNGLRCVAGWLAERRGVATGSWTIDTDAGPRTCELTCVGAGRYDVRADMGVVGVTGEIHFDGHSFTTVDVGNPHAVCFEPVADGEGDILGPRLERHIPGGVNVELVRARGTTFEVVVWERGVGWTQACGTGAVAVAAAAVHRGICAASEEITVVLPGGPLAIVIGERASLRGPAGRVFAGEVDL